MIDVKLPAFAHHRAESVEDACAVLAEHGDAARVLAGGQSLLPRMAQRLLTPTVLVDVATTPDLRGHAVTGGALTIRAATTTRTLETAPDTPALVAATLGFSGHVEIRNRGTAAGSLGHADPASEVPALLLALDGTVVATGARGSRRIPAAGFVTGRHATALAPDEMITAIELPAPPPAWSVQEITRRDGDFAVVGVIVAGTAVALFGVAETAVRARATEAALAAGASTDEAAAHAFDDLDVTADVHGSASYRRRAGTRLVARALDEARRREERAVA